MGIGFTRMRGGIETLDERLSDLDVRVETADGVLLDAEQFIEGAQKMLSKADDTLERAEQGLRTSRRLLPRAVLGVALVGVGIAAAIVIRRSRAGRAAARADVVEQPPADPTMEDVVEAAGEADTNDVAGTTDSVDGEPG